MQLAPFARGLPRRPTYGVLWRALAAETASRQGRLAPLDKWLEKQFRGNKSYGSRDRREIRDAFFHVFRFLEPIVTLAEQKSPSKALSEHTLLTRALALDWTDIEQAWSSLLLDAGQGPEGLASWAIPSAWTTSFARRAMISRWTPDEILFFKQQMLKPAPLWIRCNTVQTSADSLAKRLQAETRDVTIEHSDHDAFRVRATGSLYETPSFRDGCFEIQDAASQGIGRACLEALGQGAGGSSHVWDVCAGAGGKTLQLAHGMGGKGAVYATDIRAHALEECRARAKRSGLSNIRTQLWDGMRVPELPRRVAAAQGFCLALVDAPCSSSGTWRRNPEARYRYTAASERSELVKTQLHLLGLAARAVRPHGHLVYSTCSWAPEENEDVTKAFFSSSEGSDYELVRQELLGLPKTDSDAMFVAVMVRKK